MPRPAEMSDIERNTIIALREEGVPVARIAERLDRSRQGIYNFLRRFNRTGSIDVEARPGRRRSSTPRQDRMLVRLSNENCKAVSRQLKNEWQRRSGVHVSSRTVRSRLVEAGLRGRIAARKPVLLLRHKRARLEFANEHLHWTPNQWRNILWTDETPVYLVTASFFRYVRRRSGQKYADNMVAPRRAAGGGKIMLWSGFHGEQKLPIVRIVGMFNAQRYVQILEDNVAQQPPNLILMQDNAPSHNALVVRQLLARTRRTIQLPALSPDLNPLENVWAELKRRVQNRDAANLDQLWQCVQEEWNAIPPHFLNNLVESMPRRMEALRLARGGSIKY
jgi:transposase